MKNPSKADQIHIGRFYEKLDKYIHIDNSEMFGPDSADSERPDDLEKYFVEFPKYKDVYSSSTKYLVARAKKGIGKSALLTHLSVTKQKSDNNVVVFKTGANLYQFGDPNAKTYNEITNNWYNIISHAICSEICEGIETPKTNSEAAILRRCGSFGGKSGFLANLFSNIKLKLPFVGFNDFSNISFQRILKEYFKEHKDKKVWFIVDDIDSKFQNDDVNVSVVSAFFDAMRTISNEFDNLFIRTCVRKDVWTTIRRKSEPLDKCEDHMLDIDWSASGMRSIIANRLRSHIKQTAGDDFDHLDRANVDRISDHKIMLLAFPSTYNWASSNRMPVFKYIHIYSGGRPRWALQLCKMSSENTRLGRSSKKIRDTNFKSVLPAYSKYRVRDLYIEHSHQCSNLEHIITAFANKKQGNTTKEIIDFINNPILKSIDVAIDGNKNCTEIQVAAFLFRTGFLEAIDIKRSKPGEQIIYRFDDAPHFFESLPSDHSYIKWEINPAFRGGLTAPS